VFFSSLSLIKPLLKKEDNADVAKKKALLRVVVVVVVVCVLLFLDKDSAALSIHNTQKVFNVTTLEVGGKAGGKSFLGFCVVCTKP